MNKLDRKTNLIMETSQQVSDLRRMKDNLESAKIALEGYNSLEVSIKTERTLNLSEYMFLLDPQYSLQKDQESEDYERDQTSLFNFLSPILLPFVIKMIGEVEKKIEILLEDLSVNLLKEDWINENSDSK